MISKLELLSLAVLLQACSLVRPTLIADANHDVDVKSFTELDDEDLKSDPNYQTLLSWHAADPVSHPKEPIREVLAELKFGTSLKERQERAKQEEISVADLPDKFDARDKWKKCKRIIGTVYDQGPCQSDYAISAASTYADRLCIKTQGKFRTLLSAQRILGCYGTCEAGYIYPAFAFVNNSGIPTGGLHRPKRGCIPFEPKPCSHDVQLYQGFNLSPESGVALPKCSSLNPEIYSCPIDCTNKKYRKKMDQDLHTAENIGWTPVDESKIRLEIMNNGPAGAAFAMYSDFKDYKKGVYRHSASASFKYMHKVKLIGWGEEDGTKYWLGVNTYNKEWGLKGLFKFPRGENYLYLESLVVTVQP